LLIRLSNKVDYQAAGKQKWQRKELAEARRDKQEMKKALGDDALNEIFRETRTHGAWLDKPVSDEVLRQLYDLMK